ncbi:MAG TPA: hypothetical protein VFQ85_12800 [Mycobacteriales bacterium]|jgi:Flp pilus assembly protein TadB|nr:hypothetical protein [Mycobacteriales bacterium]
MPFVLLAGAGCGLGGLLMWIGMRPPTPSIVAQIALVDPVPARERRGINAIGAAGAGPWRLFRARPSDLAVLRRDGATFAARQARFSLLCAGIFPALVMVLRAAGLPLPTLAVPTVAVLAAALGWWLPLLTLPGEAAEARRTYRDALAAYLDLVALGLAAGRGTADAMTVAARVGSGALFVRIAAALDQARLAGRPPASALGELGRDLDLPELRDAAATLALATAEGAAATDTLAARADDLRARQLADAAGDANADTETMTLAPLVIFSGYLFFLLYPAIIAVLGASPGGHP